MSSFCFKFSDHVILINVEWGYRALKNNSQEKENNRPLEKTTPILLNIVDFYFRKEIVLRKSLYSL